MDQLLFTATGITVFLAAVVQVQLAVSTTNSKTPSWLPSGNPNVRYYYLPDIEVYFDVKTSKFIYYDGISWIKKTNLPARYRRYDLENGPKVVLTNFRGKYPYINLADHKLKFAKSNPVQPQRKLTMLPAFNNSAKNMFPSEYSNKTKWESILSEEPENLERTLVQE